MGLYGVFQRTSLRIWVIWSDYSLLKTGRLHMIYSISGLNNRHLGRLSVSWHGHNLSYLTWQLFSISRFDCTPQKQATWIKKRVYLMHYSLLFSPYLGFCAGPCVPRHIHQKAIVDKGQTQRCVGSASVFHQWEDCWDLCSPKRRVVSQICWVLVGYYSNGKCPLGCS